ASSNSSNRPNGASVNKPYWNGSANYIAPTVSAGRSNGTKWARAGRGRANGEPKTITRPTPPKDGPRSLAGYKPRVTTCISSTNSPTPSSGGGSTSTTSL